MNKLLALHYRPPSKNGRSNSFGQYYFHEFFNENFEVRGLSFGEQGENLNNFYIIPLESSSFKKIKNFIFKLESVRLTHYKSSKFRKILLEKLTQFDPDIIYVEHILMMQYLININTKAKVILFDDDSFLYAKENNLEGSIYQKIRNMRLADFEMKAIERADYILTITDSEKSFLESLGYKNVFCVPYGIDTDYYSFKWEKPAENSVLFVGNMEHYPNREAVKYIMKYFCESLQEMNVKVKIVGRNIDRIRHYLEDGVEVYEDVSDVRPYYWNSSMFIVPILSGAGMRIKVLEAAACGIPLILSGLANMGFCFKENESIVVKNELPSIINKVKYQLQSEPLELQNLSFNARRKIENEYSIQSSKNKFLNVLKQIEE